MTLLWREWPRLRRLVIAKKKKLLLLDFDGTLVPIAGAPDKVQFSAKTESLLTAISRKRDYRLAIISGRSLKDLRGYFGLNNVIAVGNHGLELSGAGLKLPPRARRAVKLKFTMRLLAEKLRADFCCLPGVLVEDKGLSISLHYRNLARELFPAFTKTLNFFKKSYKEYPLAWRKGKKVWEIVPNVRWHKGFAASHLVKQCAGALPIVIGDDRTDEEMFKAMRRLGITVRVGRSRRSHAEYYLKSQKEVDAFLEELAHGES